VFVDVGSSIVSVGVVGAIGLHPTIPIIEIMSKNFADFNNILSTLSNDSSPFPLSWLLYFSLRDFNSLTTYRQFYLGGLRMIPQPNLMRC